MSTRNPQFSLTQPENSLKSDIARSDLDVGLAGICNMDCHVYILYMERRKGRRGQLESHLSTFSISWAMKCSMTSS